MSGVRRSGCAAGLVRRALPLHCLTLPLTAAPVPLHCCSTVLQHHSIACRSEYVAKVCRAKLVGDAEVVGTQVTNMISKSTLSSRSDSIQIGLTRACMYGRGACAEVTLKSAAIVKTNPTEWCVWHYARVAAHS